VEEIAKLAHSTDGFPPPPFSTSLFVRTDTLGICQTNVRALFHVYQVGYTQQYATFPAFLGDALNQRIAVASVLLQRQRSETFFFPLDAAVAARYARLSPASLVAAVGKPSGLNRWLLKSDVNVAPGRETVLYYLFLRNYGASFDDYGGHYVIKKGVIKAPKRL
jgi:hypothetical protein